MAHFIVRLIPHIAGGDFANDVAPRAYVPEHGARVGVQSGEKDYKGVTQFLDEVGATLRELPADSYQSGLADLHSGKLDVSKHSGMASRTCPARSHAHWDIRAP